MKATHRRFIQRQLTAREQRCLLVVVNQTDRLNSSGGVARKLEDVRNSLADLLPGVPVLGTQAFTALEALRGGGPTPESSGIPCLAATIKAIVTKERGRLLADRFGRQARTVLDNLSVRHAVEANVLGGSVQEARRGADAFHRQRDVVLSQVTTTLEQIEVKLLETLGPWLESLPARVGQLVEAARGELANITTLAGLRRYVQQEVLAEEVARWQRRIGKEAEGLWKQVLTQVDQDILGPRLTLAAGRLPLPPIRSAFQHIPDLVFDVLDFFIVFVLPNAGDHTGLKVLRTLAGLFVAFTKGKIKGDLRSAVEHQLNLLPRLFAESYEDACADARRKVLGEVQRVFQARVAAVEAGFLEACNRLEQSEQSADSRRQELDSISHRLAELRQRLAALPAEVASNEHPSV